jgi:carboxylesterase
MLVMQGRLDPTVHPDSPQIIYDQVSSPIKELHWLEHSTHCVILDRERELAFRLTLEFLTRVLADGPKP